MINLRSGYLTKFALTLLALVFSGCKVEITKETTVQIEDAKTTGPLTGDGAGPARVMTYNIQYLNSEAIGHGDRIQKLQAIIKEINPTVVGVQEVDDRNAMHLVFPPDTWTVIIDDDSQDKQDVAFAVRKPWKVANALEDLDADDQHFLAEGSRHESFFPNRRDALFVHVESADGNSKFTVVNVHAKARVGGRGVTEERRVGSSRVLIEKFRTELKGRRVVLLGDFNDTPDDASLNILETANPETAGGIENGTEEFMINLSESLWATGMVTHGASAKRLDKKSGLINNIYSEARIRNDNARGRDAGTGPIMFDQILVSQNLKGAVAGGSATIYRNPLALTGEGFSRPSDHLPVYVDLK